jgi:acyl dehydratase
MKFKIGDKVEETFSYNQEQINQFIALTGDANPIHFDNEFASQTIFKKPIIHGFLSGSIFSKILGMVMPGYGTIYLTQNMNFKKAMYVDHSYTCEVTITGIKGSIFELETVIKDEAGDTTIDGSAVVMNKTAVQ